MDMSLESHLDSKLTLEGIKMTLERSEALRNS